MDEPLDRPRSPRPAGGKVLARLALFESARGLPPQVESTGGMAATVGASRQLMPVSNDVAADDRTIAATYAAAAGDLTSRHAARAMAASPDDAAADAQPAAAAGPSRWRPLGPAYIPNGQTYGSARVDVAGRVSAIAIDPSNRDHVLVGAAHGGVWESFDRGASWMARSDDAPTLTVGAIAFDPSNPSIVYCGTGEGNWYSRFGAGVLRSLDGGSTWGLLVDGPFVGTGFFDLIVHPADNSRLFAATRNGLYVSSDAGQNWTQALHGSCFDLSLARVGARWELLAATTAGAFRSTDGGATFSAVTIPGAPASWDRLAVAHAPSRPRTAYLFGSNGGAGALYRRVGQTWKAVPLPADLDVAQAWYDWFLAVSPDQHQQVYLGAIDAHRGDVIGTTWSWEKISSRQVGDSIHPDQHVITFDPTDPATVYVGNDGGVYRSTDRGTTWQALNQGLGITEVEYLTQRLGSVRWLTAGTQDNGSMRYLGSPVWEHSADGDGGDCATNLASPDTVFHSYFGMGMERSTTGGGWGSYGWIGPNVPGNYGALFYPPLATSGSTVAQAGETLFVSRNDGTNWTEINLGTSGLASAMHLPTADEVLIGTTSGEVLRVSWNGVSWAAPVTLTSPRGAWLSDIATQPGNNRRIWVTSTELNGGRVFRSDDGGSSWTDCSAGLSALPMNAIEPDPADPSRVWVAADLGVFESRDAGATWSDFSWGLPNMMVADLVFHPHARVLRAGSRNRGVWEIDVDPMDAPICATQWNGTLAGHATATWFTFNWPATWHVVWTVMPTSPRPGAPQLAWTTKVERANDEFVTYWIEVRNLTPDEATFEGRFAILSRY